MFAQQIKVTKEEILSKKLRIGQYLREYSSIKSIKQFTVFKLKN